MRKRSEMRPDFLRPASARTGVQQHEWFGIQAVRREPRSNLALRLRVARQARSIGDIGDADARQHRAQAFEDMALAGPGIGRMMGVGKTVVVADPLACTRQCAPQRSAVIGLQIVDAIKARAAQKSQHGKIIAPASARETGYPIIRPGGKQRCESRCGQQRQLIVRMMSRDGFKQRCRHHNIAERAQLDDQYLAHDTGTLIVALPMTVSSHQILGFHFHAWRRGLGNFALLSQRHCVGQIASMHQSGTHWLKFMLANALSYQYGTPPPAYNHANDVVGGPRDPIIYAGLPRLVSSHSMPHSLLRFDWMQTQLRLPRYLVLVRDLRASLASNYVKWSQRYAVDFSTYLHGDVAGRRYNSDIWWTLRFMNAWGAAAARAPQRISVLRYEDLASNTLSELTRVAAHLQLHLSAAAIVHGVAQSDKSTMAQRDDPQRPPGAVRIGDDEHLPRYSRADLDFVSEVCRRCLRYDFGYVYGCNS